MKRIGPKTKLADIINLNYQVVPLLNRFDIFFGFGDKTVEHVCAEKNINQDFFVEIINAFLDREFYPRENLQKFQLKLIVDYLRKTHTYYLENKIPRIERLINELIENCCDSNIAKVSLIQKFYHEFKNEITEHINFEDNIFYPFVLKVEKLYTNNESTQNLEDFPFVEYTEEHSNVEGKINDLKNLIIKYIPIERNIETANELLYQLFEFEKDLQDHQRIEDRVLVQKLKRMTKELGL